ncbi:MAG TPA: DUF222 domain-containing protein [Nocardioidaceae bacterium]|nr:DUF222 domain-containing protein [Nocardioidaceae bacterium]
MVSEEIHDLGVEDVLDAVEIWHAERTDRDMRIFVAAAHFADLHHPDSRPDRCGRALPGMERPKRLGGVGTPKVLEFAAAEFAARLGRSPYGGWALIADALDVRHRLPRLWARVCAGEVSVRYARHVAQQTRDLTPAAAGLVDSAVVEYADGRLCWSRFETLVAAKVVEADPDAAAEAERAAAEEEFAKLGRSNAHGQKTLYVKSSTAAMLRINATIGYFAAILAALGDTDTEDHRRAKAMLILANPVAALQLLQAFATLRAEKGSAKPGDGGLDDSDAGAGTGAAQDCGEGRAADAADRSRNCGDARGFGAEPETLDDVDDADHDETGAASDGDAGASAAFCRPFRPHEIGPDSRYGCGFDPKTLLPTVTVYLHLYARTDTGEVGPVARWEGEGPITARYVRDVLGPACRFAIKPVIDLAGLAPVDGYEIPDRHREAVHLRTPADIYPWASNTSRRQQLDHTQPYVRPDHGGPPGQTGLHNLGPMTPFHHRIKTFAPMQLKQPFPGIYLWRDRRGHCYLVDHTGTRRLGRTDPRTDLPDLTLEAYADDPAVDICYQPHHMA